MRVFVTGANGFVGSAVVAELLAAGHRVLGLVRSDAGARAVAAAGAEVRRGSLEDAEGLARAAAECDGVVHTAYNHDFANVPREAASAEDMRAIEALGGALAGTGRPLVMTSGMAVSEPGRLFTEDDVPGTQRGGGRALAERVALGFAPRGVRPYIVRLSPSVHGDGDHGLVPALIDIARARGVSAYVGDGTNRWPAVHRLDAARIYRLVLERAPSATAFHGIGEQGVPARAIAEAIGLRLGVPVVSKPREEAEAHFGWLGGFFALDLPSSSALTQARLGWEPREVGLVEDLERGRYFDRELLQADAR